MGSCAKVVLVILFIAISIVVVMLARSIYHISQYDSRLGLWSVEYEHEIAWDAIHEFRFVPRFGSRRYRVSVVLPDTDHITSTLDQELDDIHHSLNKYCLVVKDEGLNVVSRSCSMIGRIAQPLWFSWPITLQLTRGHEYLFIITREDGVYDDYELPRGIVVLGIPYLPHF